MNPITQEDKATRELYKLLYIKREKTQYNDVKELINRGARLRNVRSKYGLPICLALNVKCSIDIIQLIKENGGVDFEYKSYNYIDIGDAYYTTDKIFIQYEINIVDCVTIKNELIKIYEYVTGKRNSENTLLQLYSKHYPEFMYRNIPDYNWSENDKEQQAAMKYLLDVCAILEINIEDLKTFAYKYPENVTNTKKLPSDSHPYNWHHWDYSSEHEYDYKV